MSESLEARIQADFSGTVVLEHGPLTMGFCYLKHLAARYPLQAIQKSATMWVRYVQYRAMQLLGREKLEDVFSIYEGMPTSLIDKAVDSLTLNPDFLAVVEDYKEEHELEYCFLDICTRDASRLVFGFLNKHQKEFVEAGIYVSAVYSNTLEEKDGVLTGEAYIPIRLETKAQYLEPDLPYFTDSEEDLILAEELSDIRLI